MENREVARILRETASLLEIDGAQIGRYRSYEKAAELVGSLPEPITELAKDTERLTALPGIGDRMAEHIQEILKTGDYNLRKKLLKNTRTRCLTCSPCNRSAQRKWRCCGARSRPPRWMTWRSLRAKKSCATCLASAKRASKTS